MYVVETESGKIKIGITTDPKTRMKSLKTITFEKIINQFLSIKCSDYMDIEKELHDYFNDKRLNGEWFDVPFEDAVNKFNTIYLKNEENELSNFEIMIPKNTKEIIFKESKRLGIAANAYMVMAINNYANSK